MEDGEMGRKNEREKGNKRTERKGERRELKDT